MATTDARPGFKLPWSPDRNESDASASASTQLDDARDAGPAGNAASGTDSVDPWGFGRGQHATTDSGAATTPTGDGAGPQAVQASLPKRKPNRLMADLTRAMQTAAETARVETLERLQADAKAFIEEVHARSGSEAADLRSRADEDVAGIREWSKAEIARIREETDRRVTERKASLEGEIEAHAARIEHRIERVQGHVGRFEAEMAAFFEKLLAEDDPTHLAAMAENLPEPPSFDEDLLDDDQEPLMAAVAADVPVEVEVVADSPEPEPVAESTVDTESAFAAIQAAAEAAAAEETDAPDDAVEDDGPEAADTTEAPEAPEAVEAVEDLEPDAPSMNEPDPRFAALGLTPDAAAEAEAAAEVDATDDREEIATFSDDALAARLAGLVPGADDAAPRTETHTTKVLVTGLISVASIAGFKRQLGRLSGVESVGVSSGPEGEFVFAVAHTADVSLTEAVPTLTDFAAEITGTTDDTITVAARDPETSA
jgi:hypothetical protein